MRTVPVTPTALRRDDGRMTQTTEPRYRSDAPRRDREQPEPSRPSADPAPPAGQRMSRRAVRRRTVLVPTGRHPITGEPVGWQSMGPEAASHWDTRAWGSSGGAEPEIPYPQPYWGSPAQVYLAALLALALLPAEIDSGGGDLDDAARRYTPDRIGPPRARRTDCGPGVTGAAPVDPQAVLSA